MGVLLLGMPRTVTEYLRQQVDVLPNVAIAKLIGLYLV